MKKLVQKNQGFRRTFEILDDGIEVELKEYNSYFKRLIKFDEIGTIISITGKRNNIWLGWFIASVFFNLALLVCIYRENIELDIEHYWLLQICLGVLAVIVLIATSRHGEKEKHLSNERISLPFYYSKKHEKAVDEFIENILTARREFFKAKFIHNDVSEDVMTKRWNYEWLLNNEMISRDEFDDLLAQLENMKIIKGL